MKQKLDDVENQSWYFKQGLESKREKLASLKKNYEDIRIVFNESTLDDFLYRINRNETVTAGFTEEGRNSVTKMCRNLVEGKNELLTELIRLKSKTDFLEPIDHYLDNPDEFLKFIE